MKRLACSWILILALLPSCSPGLNGPVTATRKAQLLPTAVDEGSSDPCRILPEPSPTKGCNNQICNQRDRVQLACELRAAIIDRYASLYMKNQRLAGFDSVAHLDQCVSAEKAIAETHALEFLDRIRACIAGFQDTHFNMALENRLPFVVSGLFIRDVGGHAVIAKRAPKLLSYAEFFGDWLPDELLNDVLAVGNEVLEIDGKTPAALAKELEPYEGGSSRAYVHGTSFEDLTFRDFKYPTEKTQKLVVRDKSGNPRKVELPWWVDTSSALRPDTRAYFDQVGILGLDAIRALYPNDKKSFGTAGIPVFEGFSLGTPLFSDPKSPLTDVIYQNDDGSLGIGLRTGIVALSPNKSACYLQLLSFDVDHFPTALNSTRSFIEPIRDFVSACKSKSLDLILDLKINPGGHSSYPAQVLSVLTQKGASYNADAVAFRTTRSIFNFWYPGDPISGGSMLGGYLGIENRSREFSRAFEAGELHTKILLAENTVADDKVGGYEGKIVAVVTPECISSCDHMAAALKKSNRATIVGGPSNGTGSGYTDKNLGDLEYWRDSNEIVKVFIPNHLFGVAEHPAGDSDADHLLSFEENAESTLLENRPTLPDVPVELSSADITGTKNSYVDAVKRVLGVK